MRSRPWIAAAVAITGILAWKAPPTTAARRYRLDLKTTQVIDLKAVGQTEQRQEFGSTGFLSVSIADTTGGKTLSVVLDSLKPDSASPVPSEAAKAAAGTTWHGVVGSNGRITGLQASSDNPVAVTLTALLREFLPPVPAGVAPGKAWTDTTENNDNVPNGSMAVRTITNFQSSSETYEGVKALKIASASSSSFSGNQETGGGSAAIEGTGTGTGLWYLGPDGTYLGGKRSSTQNLTVSGAFAPEPLPVVVTLDATTSLLK
jgi:hypothetical protein